MTALVFATCCSFHLLYKGDDNALSNFDTLGDSLLTVFVMALGSIEVDTFTSGPDAGFGIVLLVSFLLLLPIVLLNALIALMGNTFSKVHANKITANLLERSMIILEMEESMRFDDKPSLPCALSCCRCCLHHDSVWTPVVLVLLTISVPFSENPVFLHVRILILCSYVNVVLVQRMYEVA